MKDINEEIRKLYLELQNEAGFKIGDKVKVLRGAKRYESGWDAYWVDEMDNAVGKIGKIIYVSDDIGITVDVDGLGMYIYPYFVLEKVVEQTYHVGQHFIFNDNSEYLLARVGGNEINLFNLSSGGKCGSSVRVDNDYKIKEDEMKKLADTLGMWKSFKLKGE